ncbi:DUF2461 domain-containing protein [Ferruginibacter sp.]|nr:DUF2461 domain-containing protein [Ferruginibacter sp.]
MLQPSTLKFLKDLKKNNNRPWFEEHRKQYENAKEDFLSLTEKLIAGIAVFDPPIAVLKAKECTFRINRDVRFSKDKSPYKNNIAGYFNRKGKKGNGAGYYLHIEPGQSFAAGGLWMPEPADLAKIRQEIDYSFDEWKKITGNASFKKTFTEGVKGDALVRPPKGYEETNPAIVYLKMKSFIVSKPFTDAEVQSKSFVKDVANTFKTMKPIIDFLNAATE